MGLLKTPAAAVLLVSLFSCEVDLAGTFVSTDLDTRLRDKDVFHFHWLKEDAPTLPADYSFLVLSDTHITEDTRGLETLKTIIDRDDTDGVMDEFVVITGDITDNGSREYLQSFVDIFGDEFPVPCYPVIGNHDLFFGNWLAWRELVGSTCYSINGNGTRLIILDSGSAFFGGCQIDWLKAELDEAEKDGQKVFIFTHTSLFLDPVINRNQFTDWTDLRERAKFMGLIKGRCGAVFTGHIHERIEKTINGIRFVALEDYKTKRVYCRVRVSASGIEYEFHTL